jgi:hypothetical protein
LCVWCTKSTQPHAQTHTHTQQHRRAPRARQLERLAPGLQHPPRDRGRDGRVGGGRQPRHHLRPRGAARRDKPCGDSSHALHVRCQALQRAPRASP